MLIIRESQIRALEATLSAPLFENRMVAHLREQHPIRFGGSSCAELQTRVRRAVKQAQSCGLYSFPSCAIFLELTVKFGDGFPRGFVWAEKSLAATTNLSGDQRAEALLEAAARCLDEAEAYRAAQMEEEEAELAAKAAAEEEFAGSAEPEEEDDDAEEGS
jgi:hypothetical protein